MRASIAFWIVPLVVAMLSVPVGAQTALDRVQPVARVPDEVQPPERAAQAPVEIAVEDPQTQPAGHEVLVGAVTLAGLEVLQPADFAGVITPRLGQVIDANGLRELTGAIVAEARARGFAFATARIAPQRLASGVLTIEVDEGHIDEIRLEGPEQPAVRAALSPLVNGAPAKLADVERRLLIAGDIDGVRILDSRYVREQDRGILLVGLSEDPAFVTAVLSNQGTRPLGPVQLRIDTDINGLLSADDQVTLSYTGTPAEFGELHSGMVRYVKRVNSAGTEVALTAAASRSRPGAYLREADLRSQSWYVGLDVLQPLARSRSASLWFEGELALTTLKQWRRDILVRDEQIAVARATVYGYADIAEGRLRSSATLSQGWNILDASGSGNPFASRFDAGDTFTTVRAWTEWTRPLGGHFALRMAARGQIAAQPLLIGEEVTLGGTGFLRGYDWSERSGDQGIMGMAELAYDWEDPFGLFSKAQFYGFADGGKVSNIDSTFGSGSLASAGGGLRLQLTDTIAAAVELAVPLSGPRYDTGDESPKLNMWLAKSF